MLSIQAVYENGVLRPTQPLNLREGQTVELTVTEPPPPPTTDDEWERKMKTTKTFKEWADLMNSCPNTDPDFDIVKAINESRKLTGFRMVDPAYQEDAK